MKIWFKYIIGIGLGTVLALLSTPDNTFFTQTITFLTEYTIQFGRYSLYPAVFFAFTVSIFELRENKHLLKITLWSIALLCSFAVLLAIIGLCITIIHTPARIPIFTEGATDVQLLGVREFFLQLFPSSSMEVFTNGTYLLPLCIFAGFAGAGCAVDKTVSKPVVALFDSLARISYTVLAFFVDMFAFGMIILSTYWMIQFRTMLLRSVFTDFVLVLFLTVLFISLVFYPAIIKLLCREVNPYRILYASLAPILAAFFSGDSHIALCVALRHTNESLGIRRRISTVVLPVFSIFGRAGSALVITISFIVILKSYSSLTIKLQDMAWLFGMSALFSCFLGRFPVGGTYIALAALCALYGRGFESGYLILKPAAFIISSTAAVLNTLNAIAGTYIIGYHCNSVHTKDLRFFI